MSESPERLTDPRPVIDAVAAWLDAERARIVTSMRDLGLPLSIAIEEPITTPTGTGGYQSQLARVNASPFTSSSFFYHLQFNPDPRLKWFFHRAIGFDASPGGEAESDGIGELLRTNYGERWGNRSPWPGSEFFGKPLSWLPSVLYPVRAQYLQKLDSLEFGDREIATKLAEGLVSVLSGAPIRYVSWLPVAGFQVEGGSITEGDMTVRALSPQEMGALNARELHALQRPGRYAVPPIFDFRSETHALELRAEFESTSQPNQGFSVDKLLLALQLLGFEPHGHGFGLAHTEPGPSLSTSDGWWRCFALPKTGSTKLLSVDDLRDAATLARCIPSEVFGGMKTRQHVALHRFLLGACEGLPADALIDYTVTLEALFLPESFEGELGFRLRLFGAHFIGETPEERRSLYGEFNQVYKERSALVHGLKPWDQTKVAAAATTARKLAARALRKALTDGFPNTAHLEAKALNL